MDGIVFLILLLTGSCGSLQNKYYFIKDQKTWDDAQAFCVENYDGLAEIHNVGDVSALMSTTTSNHMDNKAWIGLFEGLTPWTWTDGEPATYFRWISNEEQDVNGLCVVIENGTQWRVISCSEKRLYLCQRNHRSYSGGTVKMTWESAKKRCIEQGMVLATIKSEQDTYAVAKKIDDRKVWIGLRRHEHWFWSESGERATFEKWQEGQPDNQTGGGRCAAVVLMNGTWTQESCNATYPFFCKKIQKSRKIVVRMKIQTDANMEDPALSADLLRQLHSVFANQGLTDFKLTWKKPPEKQTEADKKEKEGHLRDAC